MSLLLELFSPIVVCSLEVNLLVCIQELSWIFEFVFVLYLVDVKENFVVLLPFLCSFHLVFCFLFVVAFYLLALFHKFKILVSMVPVDMSLGIGVAAYSVGIPKYWHYCFGVVRMITLVQQVEISVQCMSLLWYFKWCYILVVVYQNNPKYRLTIT